MRPRFLLPALLASTLVTGLTPPCEGKASGRAHPPASSTMHIAIRCGKLVDGKSDKPISNAVILIEGDRITQAGATIKIPADAQVIDLSRYTVIPGLIDAHT